MPHCFCNAFLALPWGLCCRNCLQKFGFAWTLAWLVLGQQVGFALPLGDVASGGEPVAATYLLLCYVTADTPEGHSQGVRAGDVSAGPQDMAQHTSAPWDTPQPCCRCVLGCWAQAGGEVVLRGGWGLRGAWGTGIIEPGLQHRCGTGRSSCLQQLVCEPGPREVNQPQGRVQGACIQ